MPCPYAIFIVACSLYFATLSAQDNHFVNSSSLERLIEGNKRYASDKLEHPNRGYDRRESLSAKQEPFAIIVGCSDSRVSPEIVFDQGIGDLFVVRNAGSVIGPISMDSVEYAVIYLHAKVIVVLGHEGCGAVTAVMQNNTKDIETVAMMIEPAISAIRHTNNLKDAIIANVKNSMAILNASPVLSRAVKNGTLEIVGGYYNLNSGIVDWIR
jgi:carbonic anhydrase